MKIFQISLCLLLLGISCGEARNCYRALNCDNENNLYVRIMGGANFLQTEEREGVRSTFDTGYIISGSLGYCFNNGVRFETEYAYRKNTAQKEHFSDRSVAVNGHYQSSSYMGNVLYDIPLGRLGCSVPINPYIGAGLGYDVQQLHAHKEPLDFHEEKKGFSWQLIAGVGYPIESNSDIFVEYKYHKGSFNHIYDHSIAAGLSYRFALKY